MTAFRQLQELSHTFFSKFWTKPERVALLRILYEAYNADGIFKIEEQREFYRHAFNLLATKEDMEEMDLDQAIQIMKRSPAKMKIVYLWIADAIVSDNEFNAEENAFVHSLEEKYGLDHKRLFKNIRELQTQRMEKLLNQWMYSVEKQMENEV
ncbi:MAG: hypothetical protein ACLFR1_13205 [Spirochaetia bacterium]